MAKKIFRGNAVAVAQVDHVTPANVEEDDIFTVTLENHAGVSSTISFTATAATVQNVVEGLCALAVAAAAAATVPWNAVTATEDDTKLILTADVAGVPFWCTAAATEGGGNDTQTHTRSVGTAVGGPSIWSDATNWAGTIYANGDDVVVPADLGTLIYGESYTATKPDTLTVEKGYAYAVGSQDHPLEVSLQSQATRTVEMAGNGTGQQFWALNYAAACRVRQAPTSEAEGDFGLNLTGTNNTALYVQPDSDNASISVGANAGDACEWATVLVERGQVDVGPDVVKNGAAAIDELQPLGGTVLCRATATAIYKRSGSGVCGYRGGDVTTVDCFAGQLDWEGDAAITSLSNAGGGYVNFDAGNGALTVTHGYLAKGYHVRDTKQRVTVTNGWDLVKCRRNDGTIDRGMDYTETHSAI